jgi:hypothetical protein
MRWLWIPVILFSGVAGYLFRAEVAAFIHGMPDNLLRETKREKEVRKVFDAYARLVAQGDPRSENVYLPDARVVYHRGEASAHAKEVPVTMAEYRGKIDALLAKIKAGKGAIRFTEVQCREIAQGGVQVSCSASVDGAPTERVEMVFVNTGPQRWAVAEETHRAP